MILCSNDDGLGTVGLNSMVETCRDFDVVKVIAPNEQKSLCSHGLNPTGSLALKEEGKDIFSLTGTPADCTRIALCHFEETPRLVCSGINHGGNLGEDALYSGTMAATREAYRRGISGISFSMVLESGTDPDWKLAARVVGEVLKRFEAREETTPVFWNVNVPVRLKSSFEILDCLPDPTPMALEYERTEKGYKYHGDYHQRPRIKGRDVDLCFSGFPVICDLSAADAISS